MLRVKRIGFGDSSRELTTLFRRGRRPQPTPCFAQLSVQESYQTCIALLCVHLHSLDSLKRPSLKFGRQAAYGYEILSVTRIVNSQGWSASEPGVWIRPRRASLGEQT